jgi:hypothetical protein
MALFLYLHIIEDHPGRKVISCVTAAYCFNSPEAALLLARAKCLGYKGESPSQSPDLQEEMDIISMEDNKLTSDLLKAIHGLQDELHKINQTLATIAAGQSHAGPASRPAPNSDYAPRRTAAPSRPDSRRPAPKRPGPKTGMFNRSDLTPPPSADGEGGSRFPKKKSVGSFTRGKSKPAGKLPPKKGDGYPKKPR